MTNLDEPAPPSALLIANPAAGSYSERHIAELTRLCREHLAEVTRIDAFGPAGAAARLAEGLEPAPDLIVVAGGDGTVRAVAECLVGAAAARERPTLLVVPLGSGNSLYSTLWGDLEWRQVVASALPRREPVRHVDLISVGDGDRAALLGVNFGLVAEVAAEIESIKNASGGPATEQRYWNAFATVLGKLSPFPVRVAVDGVELHRGNASMITVGGVRSFGRGTFKLLPQSVIDDGMLDVCVVAAETPEEIGALAGLAPSGAHLGQPGVFYGRGREVEVVRLDGEPLAMEHDGDPYPVGASVKLTAIPGAVPFLTSHGSVTERG